MNKKAITLLSISLLTLGGLSTAKPAHAAMFTDITESKIEKVNKGLDENKDKLDSLEDDVKVKKIDINYFDNLKKENDLRKQKLSDEKNKETKVLESLKKEVAELKAQKEKEAKAAEAKAEKEKKEQADKAAKEAEKEATKATSTLSAKAETPSVTTTSASGLDLSQTSGTVDTAALANYMVNNTRNAAGYSASEWKYILDHESKGRLDVYNFGGSGAYGAFQLLGHGEYQGMTLKEQIDMAQNLPAGSWVVYN